MNNDCFFYDIADLLYTRPMPERPIDPPEPKCLSARDENAIEAEVEEKLRDEFDAGDEAAMQHACDYVSDNQCEIVKLLIALDEGKEDATIQLLRLVKDWRADAVTLRIHSDYAEQLRRGVEL